MLANGLHEGGVSICVFAFELLVKPNVKQLHEQLNNTKPCMLTSIHVHIHDSYMGNYPIVQSTVGTELLLATGTLLPCYSSIAGRTSGVLFPHLPLSLFPYVQNPVTTHQFDDKRSDLLAR